MKTLKNFDRNLRDLLLDAYRWEYTDINDNKTSSLNKKPKIFLTRFQWFLLSLSISLVVFCPKAFEKDFAGYIISALSLFVGLLFTLVVSLFDKFSNTDFSKYREQFNAELYPFGVRLRNFFKKTIVLTLYTAVIAIICILLLTFTVLSDKVSASIDLIEIVQNVKRFTGIYLLKVLVLVLFRVLLFYMLLNFIYITMKLITSFYDYTISEINKVHLK